MKPNIKRFNELLSEIGLQLAKLEQSDVASGVDAAQLRYTEKEKLYRLFVRLKYLVNEEGLLQRMQGIINALEARIERLPRDPYFPVIREAQSLLAYQNLAFLAAEERHRNEQEPPELARLVVTDITGSVHFDHVLPSLQTSSVLFTFQHVGLSTSDQEAILVITNLWPDLLSVVKGRYIISEDILLAQIQLMVTAERFGLEPPVVIGCSILDLCHLYLEAPGLAPRQAQESSLLVDLASICDQLGVPLPGLPHPTALDRAISMCHLIQAMAQGVVPVFWPRIAQSTDYEDIGH